jgi:hypothetical protein
MKMSLNEAFIEGAGGGLCVGLLIGFFSGMAAGAGIWHLMHYLTNL